MRVLAHSVEIRVEADDLAGVELPLVIDPPVTPFPIDTGSDDDNGPDAAYDAQNHRWLVVFEETFSASDHDGFAQLIDDAGTPVGGGYLDATALNWQHVRCANVYSHQTFLAVAAVSFLNSKTIMGRTVHAGTAVIGPDDLSALLTANLRESSAPPPEYQTLTEKEREIVGEIARGRSNAEIASALFLSESTIKTHVGSILRKLGLRDRVQVVVFAYEHGLTPPRDS